MPEILKQADPYVQVISEALERYEQENAGSSCAVYRYNPGCIRVRIIDPGFAGKSRGERHDYALSYLKQVPDDVFAEITVLACLEPGEQSLVGFIFERLDNADN